jgi:hypothetical protein
LIENFISAHAVAEHLRRLIFREEIDQLVRVAA